MAYMQAYNPCGTSILVTAISLHIPPLSTAPPIPFTCAYGTPMAVPYCFFSTGTHMVPAATQAVPEPTVPL